MKPNDWATFTNEQKLEEVARLFSYGRASFLVEEAARIAGRDISKVTQNWSENPKDRATYLAWAIVVRDALRVAIGGMAINEDLNISDLQDMEMMEETLSIGLANAGID